MLFRNPQSRFGPDTRERVEYARESRSESVQAVCGPLWLRPQAALVYLWAKT